MWRPSVGVAAQDIDGLRGGAVGECFRVQGHVNGLQQLEICGAEEAVVVAGGRDHHAKREKGKR